MATTTIRKLLASPMRHDYSGEGRVPAMRPLGHIAPVIMHDLSSSQPLRHATLHIAKPGLQRLRLKSPRPSRRQADKNLRRGVSYKIRYGESLRTQLLVKLLCRKSQYACYPTTLLSSIRILRFLVGRMPMSIITPWSVILVTFNTFKKNCLRRCVHVK